MFASEMVAPKVPEGLPMDTAALQAIIDRLRDHGCTGDDDTDRVTQIRLLETLKSVASAVQAVLTADVARSREVELARIATESVRDKARRDVGAQIGLARRVSPRIGTRLVGMAKILTSEMPGLRGAFRNGVVDEYQALLVVAETATLSREHRQTVDTELTTRFGTMSAARAQAEAARIGYRLDPVQAVRRLRKAHADRRVTLRTAPDTMSYLTALLPAVEGVAVLAALTKHAATATALGDARGKGALMADELVGRLLQPGSPSSTAQPDLAAGPGTTRACSTPSLRAGTGEAGTSFGESGSTVDQTIAAETGISVGTTGSTVDETIAAETGISVGTTGSTVDQTIAAETGRGETGTGGTGSGVGVGEHLRRSDDLESVEYLDDGLPSVPAGVNIEIQLVITDRTLLDGDTEPATLTGYGPIPAPLARHLTRTTDPSTTVWLRRLYTDPDTRVLTRADPRRRLFTHTDRQFLITRDQTCRTPWCDAPIRHADHTQPHATGGPTTPANGAGLCAACNHTKEHPGWTRETHHDGSILVTTPTGHHYLSRPPGAPHSDPWELVA